VLENGSYTPEAPRPMPWKMHDKEYAKVLTLSPADRYAYTLGKFGDWREVFSLKGTTGFVLSGDDNGREGIPVWPHPRYAEACASGSWAGAKVELIPLDQWMSKWLPGMARDNRFVAAFPVPDGLHTAVDPQPHSEHLRAELAKYGE
jgi:hypothetical protein